MNSFDYCYTVAIIVVNYRTPDLVCSCIEKMDAIFDDKDIALVVVDNHSGDDSFDKLTTWRSNQNYSERVSVIEADYNGGFSYGNNQGINYVTAKYYLLLNSDAYLVGNSLEILLNEIRADQKIGILSPKLTWPDGNPQQSTFNYHHPFSELVEQARTGLITKLFKKYVVPMKVHEHDTFVDWTSFACVMLRREMIDDIGMLDDGFFMYYEDVDYCFRANNSGWTVKHVPSAEAVHLRGGSSNVKSNNINKTRQPKYLYQSRSRIFYKCYGQLGLLLANLCWIMGRAIALTRLAFGNRRSRGVKKQGRDIWINFLDPCGDYTHPSGDINE